MVIVPLLIVRGSTVSTWLAKNKSYAIVHAMVAKKYVRWATVLVVLSCAHQPPPPPPLTPEQRATELQLRQRQQERALEMLAAQSKELTTANMVSIQKEQEMITRRANALANLDVASFVDEKKPEEIDQTTAVSVAIVRLAWDAQPGTPTHAKALWQVFLQTTSPTGKKKVEQAQIPYASLEKTLRMLERHPKFNPSSQTLSIFYGNGTGEDWWQSLQFAARHPQYTPPSWEALIDQTAQSLAQLRCPAYNNVDPITFRHLQWLSRKGTERLQEQITARSRGITHWGTLLVVHLDNEGLHDPKLPEQPHTIKLSRGKKTLYVQFTNEPQQPLRCQRMPFPAA